jgi:DNA-binding GntR family transcriptional regulator
LNFRSCFVRPPKTAYASTLNSQHRQIIEAIKAQQKNNVAGLVWANIRTGFDNLRNHLSKDLYEKEHSLK